MNTENFYEMSDHELLCTIASAKKKELISSYVRTAACVGLFLIILITALVIGGKVTSAVNTISKSADDLEAITSNLNSSMTGMDELISSTSVMVESANTMIEENTNSVSDALGNFNSIDFDTLNKAIKDLSEVVEPLANFAGRFM